MCTEKYRSAFLSLFHQGVLQQHRIHWVQAAEWFVHDDQVWLMQQSADKLYLLLHSLRQLFRLFLDGIQYLQPLAPVERASAGCGSIQSMQLAQKNNLV